MCWPQAEVLSSLTGFGSPLVPMVLLPLLSRVHVFSPLWMPCVKRGLSAMAHPGDGALIMQELPLS